MIITVGGGTTTSTDATLNALALSGVTLSPMFAPATADYTATVANSVTQTTVTATKNDSNATVAITNDDDTSTPNTATVNLSEGANTITVTVTAEDGSTTKTYTVVVTREAPTTTGACPADAIWCADLTVRNSAGVLGCSNTYTNNHCSVHLTEDEFTHDNTDYAIVTIFLRTNGQLEISFDTDLTTASQALTLNVDGRAFAFEDADSKSGAGRTWNGSNLSWTTGDTVSLTLTESTTTTSNAPATGKPSITGAAQVGRTLTAATTGITDADGKTKAEAGDAGYAYTYQWVRVDGVERDGHRGGDLEYLHAWSQPTRARRSR